VQFTGSLSCALDRLEQTATWSMTPDEQRQALLELCRQRARLRELELRVLCAADRNQAGADSGATSTPAWLADQTKSTTQSCFRDLHLAQALDEQFDATRKALATGDIDVKKAAIIVTAVRRLSEEYDELPAGTHAKAEAHLLDLARQFDPPTLKQMGKRLFEVVCPEAADQAEGRRLAAEEERARRLAYLTMHDNGDGTSEGRLRLPTLHAELLKKALEALTSPRRLGSGRCDPATGKKLPASTLRGQGFMELLEGHLNLDSMPTVNGSPFTVVVTVGLEALKTGLGVATVDTGIRISAGEARRLACLAGIIPMVLNGDSVPLDLGREQRLFSKHQKIVLNHRYHGCAASNCDRPPAWMEYHHPHPWAAGGRTDVTNGLPLCPPHHHMADHPESWNMKRLPDGGVRFSRRM
jgi:predicted Fe-S protein YdhL (DUF1289 family)